jgi:eukaryotic-like serine/threonine-protein kinase
MGSERHRRVLVAEDADINQMLLSTLLGKWGFEAVVVGDGKAALDAALAALRDGTPFDLVLMDMQMPVMDGYAATAALRKEGYRGKIVALTAAGEADDRDKCIAAGCDDFLAKPIEPKSFRAAVQGWVGAPNTAEQTTALDANAALDQFDGDAKALRTALSAFATRHADSAHAVRLAIEGGDPEGARWQVHALIGITGSLRLTRCHARLRALYDKLRGPEPHTVDAELAALESAFDEALAAIDEVKARLDAAASDEARRGSSGPSAGGERATILVIDDAEENADVLRAQLGADYELRCVTSAEEGLALAAAPPPPDLILLDVMMPGMDGFSACKKLKEDERTRFIPIVIMTALDDVEDRVKGIEAGADDFLTKPVDARQLRARVKNALRTKRRLDERLAGAEARRTPVDESGEWPLEAGAVVGEYVIVKKIGEGAYGAVYAAEHPLIGKRAAIKVLSRRYSSDPEFVSRFIAEARAVNKIRHRNIVDVFAFGRLDTGQQYLVMELLDGRTLEDIVREGALPLSDALPILQGIADALDAAHAEGIAHRDLKPGNIFVAVSKNGVTAKLLDFGVAKLVGDEQSKHKTATGMAIGTPLYMSPEQCRGAAIDHRADVYSFGALIYELLTGTPPFDGATVVDLLHKHMYDDPPSVTVQPGLPAMLDGPLRRMLAKKPKHRPDSAGQALAELIAAANAAGMRVDAAAVSKHSVPERFSARAEAVAPISRDPVSSTRPDAVGDTAPISTRPDQTLRAGGVRDAGAATASRTLEPVDSDPSSRGPSSRLLLAALAAAAIVALVVVLRGPGVEAPASPAPATTVAPSATARASASDTGEVAANDVPAARVEESAAPHPTAVPLTSASASATASSAAPPRVIAPPRDSGRRPDVTARPPTEDELLGERRR